MIFECRFNLPIYTMVIFAANAVDQKLNAFIGCKEMLLYHRLAEIEFMMPSGWLKGARTARFGFEPPVGADTAPRY